MKFAVYKLRSPICNSRNSRFHRGAFAAVPQPCLNIGLSLYRDLSVREPGPVRPPDSVCLGIAETTAKLSRSFGACFHSDLVAANISFGIYFTTFKILSIKLAVNWIICHTGFAVRAASAFELLNFWTFNFWTDTLWLIWNRFFFQRNIKKTNILFSKL